MATYATAWSGKRFERDATRFGKTLMRRHLYEETLMYEDKLIEIDRANFPEDGLIG